MRSMRLHSTSTSSKGLLYLSSINESPVAHRSRVKIQKDEVVAVSKSYGWQPSLHGYFLGFLTFPLYTQTSLDYPGRLLWDKAFGFSKTWLQTWDVSIHTCVSVHQHLHVCTATGQVLLSQCRTTTSIRWVLLQSPNHGLSTSVTEMNQHRYDAFPTTKALKRLFRLIYNKLKRQITAPRKNTHACLKAWQSPPPTNRSAKCWSGTTILELTLAQVISECWSWQVV